MGLSKEWKPAPVKVSNFSSGVVRANVYLALPVSAAGSKPFGCINSVKPHNVPMRKRGAMITPILQVGEPRYGAALQGQG